MLGMVYDAVRVVRLAVSDGKAGIIAADTVFALICAFCTYVFLLAVNRGAVRGYLLLGELAGAMLWYLALGAAVKSASERAALFIRRTVKRAVSLVLHPFKRLFGFLGGKIKQKVRFIRKKEKKSQKILKKLLQSAKATLYNLRGITTNIKKTGKR